MTTNTSPSEHPRPASTGVLSIRVRYAECDPMNVAHHASYAPWLEMGRTELLRTSGVSYADLEADGVFLVVTKLELKYRRPIRYDDVIEVRTRVTDASRARLRHGYDVVLVERNGAEPDTTDPAVSTDGVCAVGMTELACVGRDGRPRAMPGWLIGADED